MTATNDTATRTVWERLLTIDRRIVFVFVGIALVVPFFLGVSQKMPVSREVRMMADAMERVPDGALVLISTDYDPPTTPELQPMSVVCMKYALKRKWRVVICGLYPMGAVQGNIAWDIAVRDEQFRDRRPVYGTDYVNLGFQSGNEAVIQKMGSDIHSTFTRDYRGTPIGEIPIMRGVTNLGNLDFMVNVSSGYPGTREWVQFGVDRFGLKMVAGNTAVQTTEMTPYVGKQLLGMAGGMRGAAELEQALGFPGKAGKYMVCQSVAHVIVIAFIVIGNIAYFATGRRRRGD
ncbi:MAG: hypothetical protein AB1792_11925 [Candidatus Zixiibacteriota bacterium]